MLERISDEVYYLRGPVRELERPLLDFLAATARDNRRRRCRICLHDSPDAPVHEMCIAHGREVFVPPHVHLDRAESFMILSGLATLHLLDESGNLQRSIPMGEAGSGRSVCVHIPAGQWHTQRFESEMTLFYEVTTGPFRPERNRALWNVDGPEHAERMRLFLEHLAQARQRSGS